MAGGLTADLLRAGLTRVAKKMEVCADELNRLDGQLGDGDIGVTMVEGCRAVVQVLPDLPDDVGMALMKCAQAFVGSRASSFGTLLATGLMSAAKACKGRTEVPWSQIPSLLEGAVRAMAQRGKSALGQKTVLDSLDAIRAATEGLDDPEALLNAAHKAAGETLERFRDQPAKQGRARIFGEKSVGLDDPGQMVIQRILDGLREA